MMKANLNNKSTFEAEEEEEESMKRMCVEHIATIDLQDDDDEDDDDDYDVIIVNGKLFRFRMLFVRVVRALFVFRFACVLLLFVVLEL